MGYTNYCERIEMDDEQWQSFVAGMNALFRAIKADMELGLELTDGTSNGDAPWATEERVVFNGKIDECENFFMTRTKKAFWFCKTNFAPYDFAVKAALIGLAELGGASSIRCDDDGLDGWWEVIEWMSEQPDLPSAYPKARDILQRVHDEQVKLFEAEELMFAQFAAAERALRQSVVDETLAQRWTGN